MRSYVFVNRVYWPEEPATAQLLGDLAEGLAARGHRVTVITSRPPGGQVPRTELRNGVRIVRLSCTRLGRFHVALRILDFALFHLLLQLRLLVELRRGTTLAVWSDPPLAGVAAWPVAALRSARLFHYAQDIYPEIAMRLSPHPLAARFLGLLRIPRDFAWRHSAGCVVLGSDMAALVRHRRLPADRIRILPNWAPRGLAEAKPGESAAFRASWGFGDELVVMYSGNIGRVHDLEPVLRLAERLRDADRIRFVFVGGGASRAPLEQEARRLRLENVRFLPAQPRAALASSLSAADIQLVTLKPGCESAVFPSKLYGVAAVGRPVLFIGPGNSEIAQLVAARRMGLVFERTELDSLADALRQLASDRVARAELARNAGRFHNESQGLERALNFWETVDVAAAP
ncbi:D-inositol-3-phosphate glycosyltransferase [mine drainage metagenome]|uniref:D-inositol-3-phosphate glycosyltransferase n=1 Tax=mine drainage metagenome TaxID=410659 RepID=A0A1J5STK3_9ZZZZ